MIANSEQRLSSSPRKLHIDFGSSKSQRFPSVKQRNHEQIGYSLPSTKDKRAAGFGFGERFAELNI